jgi:membrane fusion protein (multidrug efflux system)
MTNRAETRVAARESPRAGERLADTNVASDGSFVRLTFLGLAVLALSLAGCESREQPAQAQSRVPEVAVIVTETQPIVLTTELPGRTAAFLAAEVRPQVTGVIQSRLFEEGQDVNEGDVLYQIDSARYEAVFDRAKAALAMAKAELPALQARADRYKSAITERAVSQQAYDEAVSALDQALAAIAAREAELESARIDLAYTRITAPISGRIGRSNITVGALATANQPQALATIHQFDPVYVDVMQSSVELLRLRHDLETGELHTNGTQRSVRLRLEDGTTYPLEGRLQFRDVAVDPATGAYTLRLVFPNPDRLLLPGAFVRAVVQEGVLENAILVPQQGVTRTPKGEPVALVVDDKDTVQQRMLTLNRAIGSDWLVQAGLSAGERVVVEGAINVRPGATVKAVPFESAPPSRQTRDRSSSPDTD